ncbi:MAG: 50S ribosome-binding GTPase [Spiroplasmataceae bacterium]|jgi:hypothetical protein|nr:50S ribosome-binding GTPase [Spiroplasmataceae bacterium]
MTQKKTIILIGKTGNGKSAMASVLVNRDGNFSGTFEEGDGARSTTKKYSAKKFLDEYRDIEYTIIDTPGICDTGSQEDEREAYRQIVSAIYDHKEEGLSQVLFVTNGRFTEEEKKSYDLLNKAFFNEDITKFTTILRTNFPKFNDPEACAADIRKMADGNDELAKMVRDCNGRVIHVENYPDDEVKRKQSRKKLLGHLKNCKEIYNHEFLKKSNETLREMKNGQIKMIELKSELNKHAKNIAKAQNAGNKISEIGKYITLGSAALMEPFFGACGAGLTFAGVTTKYGTNFAQKKIQDKYKKQLEEIKEGFGLLTEREKEMKNQSGQNFASLEESAKTLILFLEKKLNLITTQLDIDFMFQKKIEEEGMSAQIAEPILNK